MDKISIITVVKNGIPFIKDSINSFLLQKYQNKELIIILANNNNGTANFVKKNYSNNKKIKIFYESNKTKNKFGALNRGIRLADGKILGILHSDDIFYSKNVLTEVASKFSKYPITLLYSDIIISERANLINIKRIWRDASYDLKKDIQIGWMPPHTSVFIKKKIYKKNIFYSTKYNISGDYAWIIKLINNKKTKPFYINKPLIIMRAGGDSSINFFSKLIEDLKILKFYKYSYKIMYFKYLRKINQFLIKSKKISATNYIKEILEKKIIYVNNFQQIIKKKNFILSALNLATFTYLKNSINEKNFYYWCDGIFAKFIFKKAKIVPGRIFFKNIYNYCSVNKISSLTVGTYTKKTAEYINSYKYASFCDVSDLDFNNTLFEIKKNINKFRLLILVLPTPMQERIALRIASYKKNLGIICIGGTFRIFTGEEKIPPYIYSKYNLISLWRLHTSPLRRILRAIASLEKFIFFRRNFYKLENIKLQPLTK